MRLLGFLSLITLTLVSANTAIASGDLGIGEIAKTLTSGASGLSKFLMAACVVASIVLLFTAISQYKIHRSNPKMVPLVNPFIYFCLGLLLLMVPFMDHLFGTEKTSSPYSSHSYQKTYEAVENKAHKRARKKTAKDYSNIDIDQEIEY